MSKGCKILFKDKNFNTKKEYIIKKMRKLNIKLSLSFFFENITLSKFSLNSNNFTKKLFIQGNQLKKTSFN